ncbi:MAG: UDP-N-acetylmuramoyl-tripeptide--D-alanyl-D-alanine ligase [Fibrobacterota bacterium]
MGLLFDRLESFLKIKALGRPLGRPPAEVRVVIDSRKVAVGDVFVAITGEKHDGHAFIDRTLREKAALCIVNESWYWRVRPETGVFLPVRDTVLAMLRLAEAWLLHLEVPVVAVTGSNGKTTTRALIAAVLRKKYAVYETQGNYNNRIGLPLSVFEITPDHDIAVLEMGTNHFGEIDELTRIVHPSIAVVTNIGRGHLEFLKDKAGVLRAKMEILNGMGEGGLLVVNGDDPLLAKYRAPKGVQKLSVGFKGKGLVRGARLETALGEGARFTADNVPVTLTVPGEGAAIDALLALAVGKLLDVSVREGARALSRVTPPGDRMAVHTVRGATVLADCYNANPDSMANALRLLAKSSGTGRRVAVLGDMGELGAKSEGYHRETGRLAAQCGVQVLLTYGKLGAAIAKGARAAGLKDVHAFTDKAALAGVIRASLRQGDTVLIKGSHSMHMEEIVQALLST